MTLRHQLARLRALFGKSRLERELDEEIRAHLELAEREALGRGLSPAAARREALRHFGGIEQMKELHRESRSSLWLEHLVKDARHGLGSLRREPVFAIVAIAVLALGIGANTAMFSIVNGALLRPLPFPAPDRIVRVWEAPTPSTTNSTTTRNFLELKRRARAFDALSAESLSTATVSINGEPRRLNGRYVSWDHFAVFGVEPILGRTFRAEEDEPGAPRVLILSHAAWQRQFGGDRSVIGRELRLDNDPHTVIGVLPPGVFDRDRARPLEEPASFWRLNAFTEGEIAASMHWLNPVGRLKPGVTLAQAQQDVLAVRAQIADLIPQWKKDWSMGVEPFDRRLVGDTLRQSMYIAMGAVALVLLIACANITNLLLARSAARQKELAVRAALGASRLRIAVQLLVESCVLAGLGAVAGVALAIGVLEVAVPLIAALPFTAEVTLDFRVLAFAGGVTAGVAVMVGVLPAMRMSRNSEAAALNNAARGSSRANDRTRRFIVAAEVAVSVTLICGALLLFKSLARMQQVDIGARIDRVITMAIDLPWARYPTGHHSAAFYPLLIERVKAIPGVEAASISGDVPLEGTGGENLRMPGGDERLLVRFKRADSNYFSTMGIPILAGRAFIEDDRIGSPYVTVINEALARRLESRFGITDPLGRAVDLPALGFGPDRRAAMTIVGIIGNERVRGDLRVPLDEIAYVPIAQAPRMQVKLSVRTHEGAAVVPAIRAALNDIDPLLAVADVRTLEQIWRRSLSDLAEPVWVIGIFAGIAALLAGIGLYGVVAHSVTQHRREIGIRMALGARSGDVLSLISRHVLVMIAGGVVIGLAGAAALTRVMHSLLFEVSALDPSAFIAAAAAMAVIGAIAALVPAHRATRVEPTTALRAE